MRRLLFLLVLIPSLAYSSELTIWLNSVTPVEENRIDKFNRKDWPHWVDDDKDCQSTRNETLIRFSIVPVEYENGNKCEVIFGRWISIYSGKETSDPSKLDIDHVIPLKEAHESGGYAWTKEQRKIFANDMSFSPTQLLPVLASENRSKGAKDVLEWLPSRNICTYVTTWTEIKRKYDLTIDGNELVVLKREINKCLK